MITSNPLTEKRSIGYLATGMGAIILGTEAILAQLCYAGGFTIITILTVRYWLAAVIFFAIAIIYKKPLIIPLQYRKIVLLMAGLTILGITLFFMALTKLPAALAILFLYAYPSMTAIISRVFLHRKFTPAVMASLLCSACGLLLLSWSSFATISIIGMLLALGAALEQAIKLNIMEKVLPHLDLVTYNFTVMLIAALLCSLAAPFSGSFSLQVTPTAWIYAILLSIAVTALSNFLMTKGVNIIGAVDASIIYLLEPPTTAFLAYLIFDDVLNPGQIVGGILILVAIALPALIHLKAQSNLSQPRRRKYELP